MPEKKKKVKEEASVNEKDSKQIEEAEKQYAELTKRYGITML